MRKALTVVTVTLAIGAGACNKPSEPTVANSRPSAQDSASTSKTLEIAPQTFKRMRFVSDIEQSTAAQPARHTVAQTVRHAAAQPAEHTESRLVADPMASLASRPLATVSTASAAMPEPSIVLAAAHVAEPPHAVVFADAGPDRAGDGGGFMSHVVIRGGPAANGKCDPRSDAQARGDLAGRPNSAMPVMSSNPVFGRARF